MLKNIKKIDRAAYASGIFFSLGILLDLIGFDIESIYSCMYGALFLGYIWLEN